MRPAALLLAAALAASCSPAKSAADRAREIGYQFVGAGAAFVHAFDHECTRTAEDVAGIDHETGKIVDPKKFHDHVDEAIALADRCADAAEKAKRALEAGEAALKTWSAASAGQLGCAAGEFIGTAGAMTKVARDAGFSVPEVDAATEFARRLVETFGGACAR